MCLSVCPSTHLSVYLPDKSLSLSLSLVCVYVCVCARAHVRLWCACMCVRVFVVCVCARACVCVSVRARVRKHVRVFLCVPVWRNRANSYKHVKAVSVQRNTTLTSTGSGILTIIY